MEPADVHRPWDLYHRFSVAKKHMSVEPENKAVEEFSDALEKADYSYTNQIFRIPWDREVDYALLEKIIDFNIEDKAGIDTFWRQSIHHRGTGNSSFFLWNTSWILESQIWSMYNVIKVKVSQ